MHNLITYSKDFFSTFFLRRKRKDYILTGLPRSGTSLVSTLLCNSDNSFCFNEIHYNPKNIIYFFDAMRFSIKKGKPVLNKLTTDTQVNNSLPKEEGFILNKKKINLGSKVNIPYLNDLEFLLRLNLPVVALIRNPTYTVASWSSEKAIRIPEAHVLDEDMHERWNFFSFQSSEKIHRQAEIWEFYAYKIYAFRRNLKIIRYEDLISEPQKTIEEISNYIGIIPPYLKINIINGNVDSKYADIEYVKFVVSNICKTRKLFKYN
ncbi:MAG: sulfotransferase family protein [Candidatus Electronema sp. VV]